MLNHHEAANVQNLIDAVLDTPGETDPNLRYAIEAYSAQLGGWPSHTTASIPAEVASYINKVAVHAYITTDEDIEALKAAGYSDDAIFEMTLSAALGAGMARLKCGVAALRSGGQDASQGA